jgi:CspA family cold shock protein
MSDQIVAIVKWYNDAKGYGFLTLDGRDVFIHYTAIKGDGFKTLSEGQRVLCQMIDGPKGPQAIEVTKLI